MQNALPRTDRDEGCLSDDDAAAYVVGALARDRREVLAEHIDRCDRCRLIISELALADATEPSRYVVATGLAAGQVVGRFTLTRLLGHGAMGEVWSARDSMLDREVAVKFMRVRPGSASSASMTRMRREAQAMARLNHPNVVTIHELGNDGHDRLFCAMELVAGVTLRAWLATPRTWRDILTVTGAAGRGIAAVHAAALVHRDIKPENVLIADDGRTLVSDFGLAKLTGLAESDDRHEVVEIDDTTSTLPTALTATGAMVGTPRYMAPEQLAGREVDARSDQFAYCVMVYEALFGRRPFPGETVDELREAAHRGPAIPAEMRGVPGGVLRCLVRGLATEPSARWPSMTDLLDELDHAAALPRRRRRLLAIAGSVMIVGAGVGALALANRGDPVATARDAAQARIAAIWNPLRAAQLAAAFVATGAPSALDQASRVTQLLDAYRTEWIGARVEAWSATHVRGEQTPELLERRLACLDDLASSADALVTLLAGAMRSDVAAAPQAVSRLEPVTPCGKPERLASPWFAPSRPPAKAAEAKLRELEALQITGRRSEALERAHEVLAAAEQLAAPAVVARARYDLARLQANDGHYADADVTLRAAVQEAAAVHDDYLVALIWMRLYALTGFELGKPGPAAELEPVARAAVARAGNDAAQVAELEMVLGLVSAGRSDFPAASEHFRVALARRITARGAGDPTVANDESNLSGMLVQLGELDEANAHAARAIAIARAALGEDNPVTARAESNLGGIAMMRKDWPTAITSYRAAVATTLAARGPDSPETGRVRMRLGSALRQGHQLTEARTELSIARDVLSRELPPTHADVILFDLEFSSLALDEGNLEEAERLARRGLAALRANDGPPRDVTRAMSILAEALEHRSAAEALSVFVPAMDQYLKTATRNPADDDEMLEQGARLALAAHRPKQALAWFDQMPAAAARLAATRRELER